MASQLRFLLALIAVVSNLRGSAQESNMPSLIPFRKGDVWGYCNPRKEIIIKPQFDAVWPFDNNVAAVLKQIGDSVKTGLIDTTGRLIVPYEFDNYYTSMRGNTYLIKGKANIKLVRESDGNIFIPHKYEITGGFSHHTYIARKNGRYGVIDNKENIVIPFMFKSLSSPDEKGYAAARDMKNRQGFIDSTGKPLIPLKKRKFQILNFSDDMAAIMQKNKGGIYKYGFVDRTGKVIIPPIYERVNSFSEGRCSVNDGSRSGFINKRGETVIPFKYAGAGNFKNGLADFSIYGNCGLIDTAGKEVLRTEGNSLSYTSDSFIIIRRSQPGNRMNLRYGVIDIKGREILPCTFNLIGFPENNLLYVIDEKLSYYMDLQLNKYYSEK